MAQAKQGDRVSINFTGSLADGTVIDTTFKDDDHQCDSGGCGCGDDVGPMELKIGDDQFFIPIEEALVGMAPGETKSLVIPAEDAFGEYDPGKVFPVELKEFPESIKPHVGQGLELTGDNNETFVVTVIEVTDQSVSLDANHPLAGEDLTYEFELVEIL